ITAEARLVTELGEDIERIRIFLADERGLDADLLLMTHADGDAGCAAAAADIAAIAAETSCRGHGNRTFLEGLGGVGQVKWQDGRAATRQEKRHRPTHARSLGNRRAAGYFRGLRKAQRDETGQKSQEFPVICTVRA